jgi:hypothetical protein
VAIYLAKYWPLNSTPAGQRAATRHGIQPFVDGSCRREPDFEAKYPSISALCRGRLFAPHLQEGDEVAYITAKGRYGEEFWHWRIVARLKVFKRFESHLEAADWYLKNVGELPSNCMVYGNPPLPLSQTTRGASNCAKGCGSAAATLKQWNKHYQKRADTIPVFFACKTVWKELASPKMLTDEGALKVLRSGKRVRSRLPIKITNAEVKAIEDIGVPSSTAPSKENCKPSLSKSRREFVTHQMDRTSKQRKNP